MTKSEILHSFDARRNEFRPYGLTCERWVPRLMPHIDRHNEIELNYLPDGRITYLFHARRVTVPSRRLALFWGLVPHQIVSFEGDAPYYVCTIPFSIFLGWNLPALFVDRLLKGEALYEEDERVASYDEFMFSRWLDDEREGRGFELMLLEARARLSRLAHDMRGGSVNLDELAFQKGEPPLVEQMAIYVAKHYTDTLKVADIAKAVGLHPDYANSLFRKTFGCTLSAYVVEERIAHAQRRLLSTDMSVTAIAFECGFNSISRFNAAFLKLTGCTPRTYRDRER